MDDSFCSRLSPKGLGTASPVMPQSFSGLHGYMSQVDDLTNHLRTAWFNLGSLAPLLGDSQEVSSLTNTIDSLNVTRNHSPTHLSLAQLKPRLCTDNIPDFEPVFNSIPLGDERTAFTKGLWNIVVSALQKLPDPCDREVARLLSGGGAKTSLRGAAYHRHFISKGNGSFRVATDDEMRKCRDFNAIADEVDSVIQDSVRHDSIGDPDDELPTGISMQINGEISDFAPCRPPDTQVADDLRQPPEKPLDDAPTNAPAPSFSGPLREFQFGDSPAKEKEDHVQGPISAMLIPELIVSNEAQAAPLCREERFESFASICDHTVVETTQCERGEDDEGNRTINQYTVLGDLGRGSFAKVQLVVDNSNNSYALKILNKSLLKKRRKVSGGTALAQARLELAIMKKIAHPRIVRLHEVIDDPAADKMYFVLDYINGGVVANVDDNGVCTPLPPATVSKYLRQILSALGYLHRHNIVHRDIKPSNLLIDNRDNCFLCDFGVSSIISDSDDTIEGLEGTPYFLSPEIVEGDGHVNGKAADIWALGATTYVILLGSVPFFAATHKEIYDKIQNDAVHIPQGTDPDVKSILRKMLNKSPKMRISLDELKVHPFVASEGARHPSIQDEPIIISRDDVINAFSYHPPTILQQRRYGSRASAYARRYCSLIRSKLTARKAEKARQERRRIEQLKEEELRLERLSLPLTKTHSSKSDVGGSLSHIESDSTCDCPEAMPFVASPTLQPAPPVDRTPPMTASPIRFQRRVDEDGQTQFHEQGQVHRTSTTSSSSGQSSAEGPDRSPVWPAKARAQSEPSKAVHCRSSSMGGKVLEVLPNPVKRKQLDPIDSSPSHAWVTGVSSGSECGSPGIASPRSPSDQFRLNLPPTQIRSFSSDAACDKKKSGGSESPGCKGNLLEPLYSPTTDHKESPGPPSPIIGTLGGFSCLTPPSDPLHQGNLGRRCGALRKSSDRPEYQGLKPPMLPEA